MAPTLYSKGSLKSLNNKVNKDELDNYVPIHYILNVIQYKMTKEKVNIHDRLLFVEAETGSGKTTVIPVELNRLLFTKNLSQFGSSEADKEALRERLPTDLSIYDFPDDKYTIANRKSGINPISKTHNYIACTQPKTLTAVEKAKENAEADYNPDLEIGVNTGYATGSFKQRFTEPNGIIYLTLGNMCQQFKSADAFDRIRQKYSEIMIDECHERSVELDVSVRYIKEMLIRGAGDPSMPLFIFMSATFDRAKFAEYFETPKENSVYVVGESAKKTITYLPEPSINYVEDIADMVMKLHTEGKDDPPNECDILIFVHGSPDNRLILEAIRKRDKEQEFIVLDIDSNKYNNDPYVIELLSKMTIEEAAKEMKLPNAKRRVTVSTPVAETGLTIPTLKYVIDSGWEKTGYYSSTHNLPFLITKPVTKSSSIQRFGRVGRKFYGYAYGMYTESDFDKLDSYKAPDIYTNDLTKSLLEIMYSSLPLDTAHKRLSIKDFKKFANKCLGECVEGSPSECNYLYNSIVDNTPYIDDALMTLKDGSTHDYPPQMLDPIMQDMYLVGRNRIISLGLYGTYLGYIASRISRLKIESIRMIMSSLVYGASLDDMVNIAIVMESKTGDYLYDDMMAKRSKGRYSEFKYGRLLREIIKPDILKKHYFDNVNSFIELFYDDFIRSLAIIRWIVSIAKKEGPSKTAAKCASMGINFNGLMRVLDMRKNIFDTLTGFGLINNVPELDFNSENIVEEICRIKRCIYSGYKNNAAYLIENEYVTITGIKFTANIESQRKPRKIIYNRLITKSKSRSITYTISADSICSLEGII